MPKVTCRKQFAVSSAPVRLFFPDQGIVSTRLFDSFLRSIPGSFLSPGADSNTPVRDLTISSKEELRLVLWALKIGIVRESLWINAAYHTCLARSSHERNERGQLGSRLNEIGTNAMFSGDMLSVLDEMLLMEHSDICYDTLMILEGNYLKHLRCIDSMQDNDFLMKYPRSVERILERLLTDMLTDAEESGLIDSVMSEKQWT